MTCYVTSDGNGFVCGELGSHCADCMRVSDILCDFPVGKGKTCDRAICDVHSYEIGPNLHYCESHYDQWNSFKESGGVKSYLENVVPFKR